MAYRVIQWATGERRARRDRGHRLASGARARRMLGARPGEDRAATSATCSGSIAVGVRATTTSTRSSRSTPTACSTARCSEARRGRAHPRVGQERRHAARLVLSRRSRRRPAIEAACRRGGVTLHGTGIHPGGITERFPLMISALSRASATSAPRSSPTSAPTGAGTWCSEVMLFGKAPKVARKSPMLKLLGGGFGQSIDMVADALGFALDPEKRAIHEMAIATAPIDSPIGTIAPGTVAAQRFAWQGTVRGSRSSPPR